MRSKLGSIKIAVCISLLSLGSSIWAQDSVDDDSTVRYPAAYFEEWAPVTAQDMMDRIPGLSSGGGSRGGYSSGGRGRGGPGGGGVSATEEDQLVPHRPTAGGIGTLSPLIQYQVKFLLALFQAEIH